MAVPTILTISPSTGRVGGKQLVQITGTNFRLPNAPPASGIAPTPPPSVRVTFGARVSPRVLVVSTSDLRAAVPPGAKGVVAVKVQNLDADGNPIAGELATRASGFTFERPNLASTAGTLLRVTRALLQLVKEQVLENTSQTTHTDFDDDALDGLNVTALGALPALVVSGPELRENRFFSLNGLREEDDGAGGSVKLPSPYTVDAIFTVACISKSQMELLALQEAWPVFVNANPYLYVYREEVDPVDPTAEQVRYEFDVSEGGDPRVISTPSNANVRAFTASIVVRGIDLDPTEVLGVDQTKPIGTTTLATGAVVADVTLAGGFHQIPPEG